VGTGVVAMATGSSGGWARVDGWGHQLGDNGGAYWIGRAGLDSALRVLDGRGPGSALLETAAEVFGDPASLATTLLRDSDRVRRVADFAPHVLALATAHDPVAEQICRDAARHLAETAIAAATRAACGGEQITISWSGALLSKTPVLLKTLRSTLTRLDARCELTPPAGSPLDGVGMLIDLPPQHPLTALTVRASTR
ncbi:MAG: hypothetical protein QOE54_4831, partial [Streptosporangiaceae bacterium]|nr:hypothetical protein [Streptosporangiaceae bacterium]